MLPLTWAELTPHQRREILWEMGTECSVGYEEFLWIQSLIPPGCVRPEPYVYWLAVI